MAKHPSKDAKGFDRALWAVGTLGMSEIVRANDEFKEKVYDPAVDKYVRRK
jgi:hypothetical protein